MGDIVIKTELVGSQELQDKFKQIEILFEQLKKAIKEANEIDLNVVCG